VLVTEDLAGLFSDFTPRFVRRYADLGSALGNAAAAYAQDVRTRRFPGPEHFFGVPKPAKPAELEPPEPVRTDEPHDEPSTGQSGHIRTETHNPSRESEAVRRCSGGAGSEEGAFS